MTQENMDKAVDAFRVGVEASVALNATLRECPEYQQFTEGQLAAIMSWMHHAETCPRCVQFLLQADIPLGQHDHSRDEEAT